MKKIYIWCTVLAVIFAAAAIFISADKKRTDSYEAVQPSRTDCASAKPETKTETEKKNEAFQPTYTVKSDGSDIYVYNSDNKIVEKLNINYTSLRKYDKEQFDRGITVDSIEDIYHIAEDFSE